MPAEEGAVSHSDGCCQKLARRREPQCRAFVCSGIHDAFADRARDERMRRVVVVFERHGQRHLLSLRIAAKDLRERGQ
jgi:hypothetical protein